MGSKHPIRDGPSHAHIIIRELYYKGVIRDSCAGLWLESQLVQSLTLTWTRRPGSLPASIAHRRRTAAEPAGKHGWAMPFDTVK